MNKLFFFLVIILTAKSPVLCKSYLLPVKPPPSGISNFPVDVADTPFHAKFIQSLRMGKKITIVTMGTSLTGGAYRWPDIMMKDWLDKDFPNQVKFFNEGIGASASSVGPGGDAQLSGLGRLPVVIAHRPDVVFIEFAINDAYVPYHISRKDSKKNLEVIIGALRKANPQVEIIIATMNSCKDNPNSDVKVASDRPELKYYYKAYRKIAKANQLILLDFYPAWLRLMKNDPAQFDKFVPDGIHPSLEAYRIFLLPILRETLDPA